MAVLPTTTESTMVSTPASIREERSRAKSLMAPTACPWSSRGCLRGGHRPAEAADNVLPLAYLRVHHPAGGQGRAASQVNKVPGHLGGAQVNRQAQARGRVAG